MVPQLPHRFSAAESIGHARSSTWEAILPDELLSSAQAAIAAVTGEVSTWYLTNHSIQQLGDLALLFAYLERAEPERGWRRRAYDCGNLASERIASVASRLPVGLHGGVSGAGWALAHLAATMATEDRGESPAWDDTLAVVDARLLRKLESSPWTGTTDLLQGLVGVAVYFLERPWSPASARALGLILDHLEAMSEETDRGITWAARVAPFASTSCAPRVHGRDRLGVAQGVAGVLVMLAHLARVDVERYRATRLLDGAAEWLLASLASERTNAPQAVELTWCGGDLGIAAALYQAGDGLGDACWHDAAERLLDRCMIQAPSTIGAVDATLCHGAMGVAHVFNRIYQRTREARHRETALTWYAHALAMRRSDVGVGGFPMWSTMFGSPRWIPDGSVRIGALGIALATLSALHPIAPDWDRVLLLSEFATEAPGRAGVSDGRRTQMPDLSMHALARWARAVVSVIESPADPKTIDLWGRSIGVSRGALINWCRTAQLSPKRSLDFARVLRAVVRQDRGVTPENLLDVVDLRTLDRLLALGNGRRSNALPRTANEFLREQRWIESPAALTEVVHRLEKR
jgi:lantibiotic biosynthesis protein